jgi:hypothetical protein
MKSHSSDASKSYRCKHLLSKYISESELKQVVTLYSSSKHQKSEIGHSEKYLQN